MKPLQGEELMTALNQIYEGSDDPWGLKTEADTYDLFTAANRPQRPRKALGLRLHQAERFSYRAPSGLLWEAFQAQYPAALTAWSRDGAATLDGVLTWLWDTTDTAEYPKHSIIDVFEQETEMYRFHSREATASLPIKRHTLLQQLLQQDPELYRITVTLRGDGVWKLISLPTLMDEPVRNPDNTLTQLVQLSIATIGGTIEDWRIR